MENDEDPLQITKVVEIPATQFPEPEPHSVRLRLSGDVDLLALDDSLKPKRKKIKRIVPQNPFTDSISNFQSIFDPHSFIDFTEDSGDQSDDNSYSFGFEKYVDDASLSHKYSSTDTNLIQTRLDFFNQTIKQVRELQRSFNTELDVAVLGRSEIMKNIASVSEKLKNYKRQLGKEQLKIGYLHICYYNARMELSALEERRLRKCVFRAVNFGEFLRDMKSRGGLLPFIFFDEFKKSFEPPSAEVNRMHKQVNIIKSHLKEIVPLRPGSGQFYFNILHPKSTSGQMIERFENTLRERPASLAYKQVYAIVDTLHQTYPNFSRIEQLMFDLGWQIVDYPFSIAPQQKLPPILDLFPAVIGTTLVPTEFAYTSFNVLGGMDWTFKPSVDMMFDMMICTNPFDIAKIFWDLIQQVANEMKDVLVVYQGISAQDVEIDFDSLFPILMICVLCFGQDEWLRVAMYSITFNEYVTDDPQLQFAMTYLEGLVTQILSLDVAALKAKALVLHSKYVDSMEDPLGVG